jgi:hypothetical protein
LLEQLRDLCLLRKLLKRSLIDLIKFLLRKLLKNKLK